MFRANCLLLACRRPHKQMEPFLSIRNSALSSCLTRKTVSCSCWPAGCKTTAALFAAWSWLFKFLRQGKLNIQHVCSALWVCQCCLLSMTDVRPTTQDCQAQVVMPAECKLLPNFMTCSVFDMMCTFTADHASVPYRAAKGRKEWRHMPATKSYHLHVGMQAAPVFSNNLPPIDSLTVAPHDALFTGLFLQEAAARRYISLNMAVSPYR